MKTMRTLLLAVLVPAGVWGAAQPAAAQLPGPQPVPVEETSTVSEAATNAGQGLDAVPVQGPTFKSESNLVVLHVNVFDGRSDAVANLPKEAFQVTEDDKPQEITFFSNEDVPVAVGLIVDNSGSMITRRDMVLVGVTAFAESSLDEDELFAIAFNENIRFPLPPGVKFTRSRPLVFSALRRFPAGGKTALHDAVVAGLEHLLEASHQKRVLIVLSDGEDNASRHSRDDMLERARRSNALIYAVSTAGLDGKSGNVGVLKKLTEISGGVLYRPRNEDEVIKAFAEIAQNNRRAYRIGYEPTNAARDGRFRRVRVTVRAPGYRNLTVSTRDGYLAPYDVIAR